MPYARITTARPGFPGGTIRNVTGTDIIEAGHGVQVTDLADVSLTGEARPGEVYAVCTRSHGGPAGRFVDGYVYAIHEAAEATSPFFSLVTDLAEIADLDTCYE